MSEKKKEIDWVKIIIGVLMSALAIFGFSSYLNYKKEEKARIEAQNEIARQSKVIKESNDTWSRLAQQREDAIDDLEKQNKDLADRIKEKNEQVLVLSQAVAKFNSIKIIVRDAVQTENEGRTKVSFDKTVDPINVKGFTLTNPAEAEFDVNFVRPLKLTTVVTQKKNGQWVARISGDWPNLNIEQIDTVVNPRPFQPRGLTERIILGGSIGTDFSFGGISGDVYTLYDLDSFAVGPYVGVTTVNDYVGANFGLRFQYFPFR